MPPSQVTPPKVTVPVGLPVEEPDGATAAVKARGSPVTAGVTCGVTVVAVVPRLTTWVFVPVDPW